MHETDWSRNLSHRTSWSSYPLVLWAAFVILSPVPSVYTIEPIRELMVAVTKPPCGLPGSGDVRVQITPQKFAESEKSGCSSFVAAVRAKWPCYSPVRFQSNTTPCISYSGTRFGMLRVPSHLPIPQKVIDVGYLSSLYQQPVVRGAETNARLQWMALGTKPAVTYKVTSLIGQPVPGTLVLGLAVFSFASVPQKTRKSMQSRETFSGSCGLSQLLCDHVESYLGTDRIANISSPHERFLPPLTFPPVLHSHDAPRLRWLFACLNLSHTDRLPINNHPQFSLSTATSPPV